MFTAKLNYKAFGALQKDWQRRIENAAVAAAGELDRRTSEGARSGRKWPNLPNRSSRPREYVQEQGGKVVRGQFKPHASLNDSIQVRPGKSSEHAALANFGFYDQPLGKLFALEFGSARVKGRRSLGRTANHKETRKAMRDAVTK